MSTGPPSLPNLIIPGVHKAGTTSLFRYLEQHPSICGSQLKELNYFTKEASHADHDRWDAEYVKYFSHCHGEPYRMEASPSYFYSGTATVKAMREQLPGARIVVCLREPVDRVWSGYTFLKSMGRLPPEQSFEGFIDRCLSDQERTGAVTPLSVGRYIDFLTDWFEVFGADVRCVFAEHLATDPTGVVERTCEWLGVDPGFASTIDYRRQNETITPRSMALAKHAYRAKRRVGSLLRRLPRARAALRSAYRAVNAGENDERLHPDTRRRLHEWYREANDELAGELSRRGYTGLPAWLAGDTPGPGNASAP